MLAVPNLKTMKHVKRIILLISLIIIATQISFANDTHPITYDSSISTTSKVYVVVKSATATQRFMDHFGETLKKDLAKKGIESDYAILSGKFPNAMYQIALDNGADHIVFISQTQQFNIDGKTNVGGTFEVKAFNFKNYTWAIITKDIKMNVQYNKSIQTANDKIIESFLNKT